LSLNRFPKDDIEELEFLIAKADEDLSKVSTCRAAAHLVFSRGVSPDGYRIFVLADRIGTFTQWTAGYMPEDDDEGHVYLEWETSDDKTAGE
jgi:hypothetical protein